MLLTTLAPPDDGSDKLETLAVVYSLPDAAVMQTTLRAYGIPSFTSCAAHASVHWYAIIALGGIAIHVPSSMRGLASSLIPDLANPRTRAEITAEIKANAGPYTRKRLLIAHLMMPVLYCLCNLGLLVWTFLFAVSKGIETFLAAVIALALVLVQMFLHPALELISF